MKLVWEEMQLAPDPVHGAPMARSSHGLSVITGATTAAAEQLFLYGGEHVARTPVSPPSQAVWKADLKNKQWKAIVDTAPTTTTSGSNDNDNAPCPRIAHAQALHAASSTVYVFGGRTGVDNKETALNDLWKFDLQTDTWTQVHGNDDAGPSPEARSFHRMLCLENSLYVFGGCGKTSGRLADLHRFDIATSTWQALPASNLRGRGGPNFCHLSHKLLVVAGFAGEETRDAQVFDLATHSWQEPVLECSDLRPRSVCVACSMSSSDASAKEDDCVVLFGGEVNPSDRGHEGAGGFANDVVVVSTTDGDREGSTSLKITQGEALGASAPKVEPPVRGWSAGDAVGNTLYVFGGLAGDDTDPIRLGDLWKLTISKDD